MKEGENDRLWEKIGGKGRPGLRRPREGNLVKWQVGWMTVDL